MPMLVSHDSYMSLTLGEEVRAKSPTEVLLSATAIMTGRFAWLSCNSVGAYMS